MPRRPIFILFLVIGALMGQPARANDGALNNSFQFELESGWFPIHHRRWHESDGTAVWARHVVVRVPRKSRHERGWDRVNAIQISQTRPSGTFNVPIQTVRIGQESALRLQTVLKSKRDTKNLVLDEAFRESEQLEFHGWEFQTKVLDIHIREGNDLGKLPVRIVRNVFDGKDATALLEITDNQDLNRRDRKHRKIKDPQLLNEAFSSERKERRFKRKFGLTLGSQGLLETAPLRKISRWHELKHVANILFWTGGIGTAIGGGLYLSEQTGHTELVPLVQERVIDPTQEWIAGCEDEMQRLSR